MDSCGTKDSWSLTLKFYLFIISTPPTSKKDSRQLTFNWRCAIVNYCWSISFKYFIKILHIYTTLVLFKYPQITRLNNRFYPFIIIFNNPNLRIYLLISQRETERERNINQLVASRMHLNWRSNLHICPDGGSNPQSFGV